MTKYTGNIKISNDDIDLGKLVESLTTSGLTQLNDSDMKPLKRLCRNSDDNIDRVYRMLFHQLHKNHSQIRVTTLLIINELFVRSHKFRTQLLDNLYELFELVLELNAERKLPKPKSFARILQTKAIEIIQSWNDSFSGGYPVLKSAFDYLKQSKSVDFSNRSVANDTQRTAEEKEQNRRQNIIRLKVDKAVEELNEIEPELKSLLTQINSCFELLLPKMSENDVYNGDQGFDYQSLERVQPIKEYSCEVVIKPFVEVIENRDTSDIIDSVKDLNLQLNSMSIKLKRLLHIMSKSADICETHLKRTIDLKCDIESVNQKFLDLKIIKPEDISPLNSSQIKSNDTSDSSCDEFEEVSEKEGLELIIPEHRRKEYGLEPLQNCLSQPSTSGVQVIDTENNGKQCNALLPSGKLCPRRDKIKCPFHGPIIERDICGVPLNENDKKREELKRNETPEWQDRQLLRDIEASIGINLSMGKRKRKKYPALKDIKELENTPRRRLEKKIFKKESRERVVNDLNLEQERRGAQFDNQWNYSLES